jgi:hypothetical protein
VKSFLRIPVAIALVGTATAALSAVGMAASVAAALENGDEAALQRLSGGSIVTLAKPGVKGGVEALSAAELVAMTRGCKVSDIIEPLSANWPFRHGGVELTCEQRPTGARGCYNVQYGLNVRPEPGRYRLEVATYQGWSVKRCGMVPPPARLSYPQSVGSS